MMCSYSREFYLALKKEIRTNKANQELEENNHAV